MNSGFAGAMLVVALFATSGCATTGRSTPAPPFVLDLDLSQFVNLFPCDVGETCLASPGSAHEFALANGVHLTQLRDVPWPIPSNTSSDTANDLVLANGNDAVYRSRIRWLERELQRERGERRALERQLSALRDIEREVARSSEGTTGEMKRP